MWLCQEKPIKLGAKTEMFAIFSEKNQIKQSMYQ